MSKFFAASILGLVALTQSTAAAPDQQIRTGHQPMVQKVVVQKIGITRPMFHAPIVHKPIFAKPIFVQPAFYKPVVHKAVIVHPIHVKHIVQPSYYNADYKPMYRYYPPATYSYDSAPKECLLVLHKSYYGMVKKVWRCAVIEKVEFAPVNVYAKPATITEKVEPAPTKIIERTIERHTIEKQVPVAPTDEVLPPK